MKNNKLIIILIAGFILAVILIIILFSFNRPADESSQPADTSATTTTITTIDNFSDFYRDAPSSKLASIQSSLYDIIHTNYSGTVPSSGATIRADQPTIYTYNHQSNIYYGRFIVDIASIQQSYMVQFEWTPDPSNEKNLSGYSTLVTCLPDDLAIYPTFSCADILTSQNGSY